MIFLVSNGDAQVDDAKVNPAAAVPHDAFEQEEMLSKLRAMALFPDIEKEGSPLHQRMDAEIADGERTTPENFRDPEWPTKLARFCAGCLGIRPQSIADILQHTPDKKLLDWGKDPHFKDLVIRSAVYSVGKVDVDIRRKLQGAVKDGSLMVVCDDALLPNPADVEASGREDGESGREYWKRQLAAMKASTQIEPKAMRKLKVTFEREGQISSLVTEQGHALKIEPLTAEKETEPATETRKESLKD